MNRFKKSEPEAPLQAVSLKIDPEIWMKVKIVSVQRSCSPSLVVQAALVFYINSLLPSGAEPSEAVESTEPVSEPVANLQTVSLKIDPKIRMKVKIVSVQRSCSPSLVVQAALVFYINSLLPSGAEPSEAVESTEPVLTPAEKTCTTAQSK